MRLGIALEEGLEISGPVLVRHPSLDTDLSALTNFDVETPDYRVAQRYPEQPEREYEATLIIAPRAKDLLRDLIATAPTRRIIVDGQKTDGIDSLWRTCRKMAEVHGSVTKAHGRLFWMDAEEGAFDDWHYEPPDLHGFVLAPGVFSADGIDPGSYALAEVLPAKIDGHVIDLGAGWGYLSAVAEARGATDIDMVETNAMALACAAANTQHARGHWSDATNWKSDKKADHVLMNPPFHEGRKGTPELGIAFIANAARNLAPRGTLWMVANRHLPYEETLLKKFAQVTELEGPPGTQSFKLFQATRPKR
ncbi:MAG: methyltransferase [Rhodobacteraceae bacterium]|nr:methyltransferase [Paracoccaceae bacterium]